MKKAKTFNVEFDLHDLEVVNFALCNMPYKDVVVLIEKINRQIKLQSETGLEKKESEVS